MADDLPRLSIKQQRFVNAYLGAARGNATEAARMADYADPELEGWRCRQSAVVRAHIDARLEAESLSASEVLRELTDVARSPVTAFMQVVRPAETDEDGNETVPMMVRLDYGSKVKSLELLGKYWKLFTDKTELSNDPDNPPLIRVIYDDHRPASAEAASGPGAGD